MLLLHVSLCNSILVIESNRGNVTRIVDSVTRVLVKNLRNKVLRFLFHVIIISLSPEFFPEVFVDIWFQGSWLIANNELEMGPDLMSLHPGPAVALQITSLDGTLLFDVVLLAS